LGAVLALYVRRRRGIVQKMNTNLLSGGIIVGADGFMRSDNKPPRILTDSEHYGLSALRRLYQATDGWLYLAADSESHWNPLCNALGANDLASDNRFESSESRSANGSVLAERLQVSIGKRNVDDAIEALRGAAVPCAPVVGSYDEAFFEHPQGADNGLVSHLRHPNIGGLSLAANLIKFSGRTGGVHLATPLLGEQTRDILGDAGYSESEVDELYEKGVAKSEFPA
jgi:crotonobetainyl-CoA:carnitine CoA-transferase CaiB-like acyl-CoA transferase